MGAAELDQLWVDPLRTRDDDNVSEAAVIHDEAKLEGEPVIFDPFPSRGKVGFACPAAIDRVAEDREADRAFEIN